MNRLRPAIACAAFALCLRTSEAETGWQNLGTLKGSDIYTVIVLRNGQCESGRFLKVESDKITLASGTTLARSDVLYIGQDLSPHDILYSGRSSWYEVKRIKPSASESLEVRLKSGRTIRGSVVSASDSDITIKWFGRAVKIAKQDVAHVNYTRFKPVPESDRYLAQEAPGLVFFDPKWWQYLLRINAFQSIPIYDSAVPEDNSPLSCYGRTSQK